MHMCMLTHTHKYVYLISSKTMNLQMQEWPLPRVQRKRFIAGRKKSILMTLNRKFSHLFLRVHTISYFQNTKCTRTNQSLATCVTVVPAPQNIHLYLDSSLGATAEFRQQHNWYAFVY